MKKTIYLFIKYLDMKQSKYFSEKEFNRCTPSCSREDMEQPFLNLMDAIRAKAGIPLVINCAYRSRQYDLSKGRSGNSAHTRGLAVDFKCLNNQTRQKILKAVVECGVTRYGIGRTFIHVDMGERCGLNPAVWVYDDNGNAV